jgi:hypothetical protein
VGIRGLPYNHNHNKHSELAGKSWNFFILGSFYKYIHNYIYSFFNLQPFLLIFYKLFRIPNILYFYVGVSYMYKCHKWCLLLFERKT